MGVRVTLRGADEAIQRFHQLDRAANLPLRPLFEKIAEEWRAAFQQIIRDQPGDWPNLSPTTIHERKKEGFGPTPILQRSQTLMHSINTLAMTDTGFEVGTDHKGAALLHHGGRTSPRSRYPDAPVPARPFIVLSDVVVSGTFEMIDAYFFGDDPAIAEPALA